MSPLDSLAQETVTEYLSEFASALGAYLRPSAGKLGSHWLGIDRAKRSMLVRWSEQGFSAFGIDNWLGKPVVAKYDPDGGLRIRAPFRSIAPGRGDQSFVAVAMKQIRPTANATIGLTGNYTFDLSLTSEGALAAIGPECFAGLTKDEVKAIAQKKGRDLPSVLEQQRTLPPWTVALISRGHPENLLTGFDPDPFLFARGVADTILHIAGLQDDPVARYSSAAKELGEAVKSVGTKNEWDLHSLVEAKPWILVPNGEFESFASKKVLPYEERLGDGSVKTGTIVPDFLYKHYDHDTLVVEIEAGTKRLLIGRRETGFGLPSAAAVASIFQILNYSRILSGPMSSLARQQLDLPDDWAFRYLLVVGSKLQKDFDERSWIGLRDHLQAAGITLRTWDYYIERLERTSRMADFKGR